MSCLSRREVVAGMAGTAATVGIPGAALAAAGAPMTVLAPDRFEGLEPWFADELHELRRVARAERAALSELGRSGQGGAAWSRLYVIKIDTVVALRDWTRRHAPDRDALLAWLDAIYRMDAGRVAQGGPWRGVNDGLDPHAVALTCQIERLGRGTPERAVRAGTVSRPESELERARREIGATAWSILQIEARTLADAGLHRTAAELMFDRLVIPWLIVRAGTSPSRLEIAYHHES